MTEHGRVLSSGPLSVFSSLGIPCLANIAFSLGMTDLADVDFTISTSGKQLYLSMCSSRKYPYPPHGRSLEIPKGRGDQRLKFPRVVGAQV